jgi:hypothetical protein
MKTHLRCQKIIKVYSLELLKGKRLLGGCTEYGKHEGKAPTGKRIALDLK